MNIIDSQTVPSTEVRRQAVIEYWALWHGECMSDRHIAKQCLCHDMLHTGNREIESNPELTMRLKQDMKFVKSMKKEYTNEKFALFRPITEEIARIRAIKRCHLCGSPTDVDQRKPLKTQKCTQNALIALMKSKSGNTEYGLKPSNGLRIWPRWIQE